jgi:hypothetical protein
MKRQDPRLLEDLRLLTLSNIPNPNDHVKRCFLTLLGKISKIKWSPCCYNIKLLPSSLPPSMLEIQLRVSVLPLELCPHPTI